MTLNLPMLLCIILLSNLLSIVVIPVAGGSLASLAILFQAVGLPAENIAMAIVAFSLADYFITPANILSNITSITQTAETVNKLDRAVLKH